jgi:predicted metal-dependent peptidase
MSKASEKISRSRSGLILDHPFFGSLALRLTPVEDGCIPTAATDGKVIRYNPEYIDGLSLDETKGLICHEVMHCANQHHARRGDRNVRQWNVACDYAINPLIIGCGMALPEGALVESQYDDMSAEQIYAKLPAGDPDGNEGAADGNDPGMCGGVSDAPGDAPGQQASKDELEQAAQEWKVATVQAAQSARVMGELPGALERVISDLVEPVYDWRELLRRFVDTNARNDYQWFPPNRRHVGNGVILPSLRSQELKNVTMALDTSGSISDSDLAAFEAEVRTIVEEYRADTTVIYCDSKVQLVERFDADTPVTLSPKGGGGTDYRPIFSHIEESGEVPLCLVVQTDGWCEKFPEEQPQYPTLWVLTRRNGCFRPGFGEVINL